jgi:hypothetical protein
MSAIKNALAISMNAIKNAAISMNARKNALAISMNAIKNAVREDAVNIKISAIALLSP